jgi:hypothetical protein
MLSMRLLDRLVRLEQVSINILTTSHLYMLIEWRLADVARLSTSPANPVYAYIHTYYATICA